MLSDFISQEKKTNSQDIPLFPTVLDTMSIADPVSPPLNATYLLGLRQLIVRLLLGHLQTLGVGLVELLYLAGVLLCQLPLSDHRLLLQRLDLSL